VPTSMAAIVGCPAPLSVRSHQRLISKSQTSHIRLSILSYPEMRKGDIIQLKIDRIAQGGQGVSRSDGFVIFVKGAVPGDTVRAVLTRKKQDFAEARVIEVVESSSDRVDAPCPYFGHCGGCQWQQVHYPRQLEYKRSLVEEAMARIGGLSGILIQDPIGSEKVFGYRNKMEFSFSDRPWLVHQFPLRAGVTLGLHVPGAFHKVLDIDACLLQEDRGNEILRAIKRFAWKTGLPAYNLKTHKGFWRFLTLRRSDYHRVWMVNVITSEYRRDIIEGLGRFLTSTYHDVKTVVNNISTRRAAIAVGEWESVIAGAGVIEDRIGTYDFRVSANSFFQTNTPAAARLYNTVVKYAELTGTENVLDLYSGTGTIPIFLSSRSSRVIGMEISESAVEDAIKNCGTNRVENCRFILGDIRTGLSSLPFKPHVLVIDPPRVGMHKDVVARVLDLATEKIVYVSCNPATMARDLAEMKNSYEVIEVQPVDMFPHTYHVESVAKLLKKKAVR
jgi:23S rRNA (uracil1939-C5)-methyltransferase